MDFLLRNAIDHSCPDLIALLLEKGADANTKYEDGDTALIRAVMFNQGAVVKTLLQSEIDLNVMDRYGFTPLQYAIGLEYEEIEKELRKAGAKE